MTSSNIDRFDGIAGKAFARLYESFPVPQTLTAAMFGVPITEHFDPIADRELGRDAEFVFSSLQWLGQAGFIHIEQIQPPYWMSGVVLTAKGLEVLKAMPDSLSPRRSVGEFIVDGIKEGAQGAVADGVRVALAMGVAALPWSANG